MNIEELKRLAEAATPGPWEYDHGCIAENWKAIISEYFVRLEDDDVSIAAGIIDPKTCRPSKSNAAYIAAANPSAMLELIQKLEVTQDELDIERLRLAACGVVAMQNTEESRKDRIGPNHRCYSASYMDVCRAVDAEIELRKQRDELLAALKDARELVDSWGAYASNYMQEKHDLEGDLSRLGAVVSKMETP